MYNREQRLDTTVRIWEDLYEVRLPFALSRSIGEMQTYGIRVSGVPSIDRGMRNELVKCMKTIADMIDLYKEGCPIRIVRVNDTKLIYEAITEHLLAWKEQLRRGININNAPVQDLILMDKFAHEIYEFAKFEFIDDDINNILSNVFKQVSPINSTNLFKRKPLDVLTGKDSAANIERESLASYFSSNMPGIRKF